MEVNLALGGQCLEVWGYLVLAWSRGKCNPVETVPIEPRRRCGCSILAEMKRRKAGARGTCADHEGRGAALNARNIWVPILEAMVV